MLNDIINRVCDVCTSSNLGMMQVYTVHGQLLSIFQKLSISLRWRHSPETQEDQHPETWKLTSRRIYTNEMFGWCLSPVGLVQLHNFLLQLLGLVWSELKVRDVVQAMFLRVIVTQLSLQGVRAQKSVCDERTGQTSRCNVLSELKTQQIPAESMRDVTEINLSQTHHPERHGSPHTWLKSSSVSPVINLQTYSDEHLRCCVFIPGYVLSQLRRVRRVKLHTEGKLPLRVWQKHTEK